MVTTEGITAIQGSSDVARSERRSARIWLAVIAVMFLAIRVPVMYRQPGGQDEDYYAVPGLTILQTGIPQLPHVPARNLESVFYRADVALYSEPPLCFYFQALFYAVLPDVYGTARLASGVAGLLFVALVYGLSRTVGANVTASLWAAGLLSLSRWFYFPATTARPDILCGMFGIAAILCVMQWQRADRVLWLVLAGVCIGLGGLTHPFAIVYAIQLGIWVIVISRDWGRVKFPAILTAAALLVFCLWVPLILLNPEVFQVQFGNQFGGEGSGSICQRAIFPGPSLIYHLRRMWEHVGAIQFLILAIGLIGGSLTSWRGRNAGLRSVCLLAWSAMFLISVAVGPHHSVIGYWVYPAGLMFIAAGAVLQRLVDMAGESRRRFVIAATTTAMLLIPGSGIRMLVVQIRHWNDIEYDSPRFARELISTLPSDDVFAVDREFALDFIVAGRRTLLAQTLPHYFRVDQFHYDYLVIGRHDDENLLAGKPGTELIRTEGIEADEFACYAEIYGVDLRE